MKLKSASQTSAAHQPTAAVRTSVRKSHFNWCGISVQQFLTSLNLNTFMPQSCRSCVRSVSCCSPVRHYHHLHNTNGVIMSIKLHCDLRLYCTKTSTHETPRASHRERANKYFKALTNGINVCLPLNRGRKTTMFTTCASYFQNSHPQNNISRMIFRLNAVKTVKNTLSQKNKWLY